MNMSCAIVASLSPIVIAGATVATPPSFDDITALLESALVPGGPVLSPIDGAGFIVQRGDVVIYRGVVGTQSFDDVIPLASATKWYSGAVIASLLDDESMQLDDPLSTWLPSYDVPDKATITVEQAFSHTSGLPTWNGIFQSGMTLRQVADASAALPLDFEPGTMFGYGGVSMHAAGAAAEEAANADWATLFADRIAGPIGMTQSAYTEFGAPENPGIGGGASTTLDDYAAFLRCIVNRGQADDGTVVLSPGVVALMLGDRSGSPEIFSSPYPDLSDYGIGVWREQVSPVDGRPVLVSSGGAFGTVPWIDFERGYSAVLLVDDSLPNVTPLLNELRALLDELLDPVCPADRNGNRFVGIGDLLTVLASWDATVVDWTSGDADGDGVVDLDDLLVVLSDWGQCAG